MKHFNKVPLLLCVLLFSLASMANAQEKVIKGVVSGTDGATLPGVNVLIKGSTQGTVTDLDGNYSLTVGSSDDILVFTFVGFVTQEVTVGGQTQLDITMEEDVKTLEEVVVVGYGTQTKKEITGAVGSVKADAILKTPTADLGESLQGQIAGVNVQASSGRPGAQANIQIRGVVSATSAGSPLYIVDGIPFQNNPNVPPEQIESIDVLKDGAAASVYGTRAAGGVILITTKRGKKDQFSVDLTAYSGIQNITSGTPLMGTSDQMYTENIMLAAIGQTPVITLMNPNAMRYNTNFVNEIQNDNAPLSSINLGVSGGSENLKLNLSANYFNQDGVLINSGFERLSTRMTGEFKKNRFRAFASVSLTNEVTEQEPWALYEYAIAQRPWSPPLQDLAAVGSNGVKIEDTGNPIVYGWLSRQLGNRDMRYVKQNNVALSLEYEFVEGLKYQANVGYNTWDYERNFFVPQFIIYDRDDQPVPAGSNMQSMLDEEYQSNTGQTFENVLTYNKTFGKHTIGLTGVYSFEEYFNKTIGTGVVDLLSNNTPVLSAGATAVKPVGFENTRTLTGKLFRAQYNFDNRYLASFSVRHDGSSNFHEKNRYGTFFGGSGGWNISEENFFKNASALEFISNLKVRASYGEVGNQNITPYSHMAIVESGIDYVYGGKGNEDLASGAIQRRFNNEDIKWETTVTRNIGVDLSLFQDKLQFTADFYENNKEDMLLNQTLTPSSGTWQPRAVNQYNSVVVNAGDMKNEGMEFTLTYRQVSDNGFNWSVTGTYAQNRNLVTNLNGVEGFALSGGRPVLSRGDRTDYTTFLVKGYPAGSFFLLENEGVIKTPEQLKEYNDRTGESAALGDLMHKDQNGDGVINDLDRVYKGSGQDQFNMGLNFNADYKGFDLFIQTYYSHGAKIYNGSKLFAYGMTRHSDLAYMWSPQNPNSDIPAARQNQEHNNTRARSDYYLEDGSYLRIRNITLGYTIPKSIFNDKINSLRFYLTAQNPFTFTNYEGYDPEIGGDGLYTRGVDRGNYPVTRRFLGGVKFNF